ncbi:MAG TPA: DUF695 domain-containing protein [Longimicrobiales bacterium]|nr:DUF695 domain-containing protein [Longimicrobiales bacterium]
MTGDWDYYFTRVNGTLASIFLDLDARSMVPDASRPWVLWVFVKMGAPREDGLSSSEEAPTLDEIEGRVTAALSASCGARLVGRVTTAGRRELYYYASTGEDVEATAAQVLSAFPEYPHQAGSQRDEEWSQYLNVLYPSPAEHQMIQNRRVVAALAEHGDPLTVPRPVRHWVYFSTTEQRAAFLDRARQEGFDTPAEGMSHDPAGGERPFGASIERVDPVDHNSIDQVVRALLPIVTDCGGAYDGWETQVVEV